MHIKDWSLVKHFKRDSTIDKWGDPDKMSARLIYTLDDFRKYLGIPIYVTSGWRMSSKFDNSQHPLGKAVDVVFPTSHYPLVDILYEALRFDFTGIGIYNYWQWNGKTIGGLHLDVRDLMFETNHKSLWLCHGKEKDQYTTLNYANLKKYGFVEKPLIE